MPTAKCTSPTRWGGRIGLSALCLLAALAQAEDWPHWGRDASRNMVSPAKNLPATFAPGKINDDDGAVDLSTTQRVKWAARLGSYAYGNPTVAGGRIFLGTNNEPPKDPKYPDDRGIVLCLDEATGKMLWQLAVPKLAAGQHCDYELVGVCSSPAIDADRAYVVTNRCEVLCLDVAGLANGNDGPFKDEPQYVAGPGKPPVELSSTDADIIWRYDMRDELGVFPHQMTSSSVLILGDRLYVTTSNGRDWSNIHIPAPNAPSLICLDKRTGRLLAQEDSGISQRIFICTWSSPALATVNGKPLILFGADDGFCYGFDPEPATNAAGLAILKEVWRYDCNPAEYRFADGKPRKYESSKGPSGIIATPVFHNNRVYVTIGQNPEAGEGAGCLSCIDPTKTGDITQTGRIWDNRKINRSLSNVAVAGDLLFAADLSGFVYCLDAATGQIQWTHDMEDKVWGSPVVADGKVYIANQAGKLAVLAAARQKNILAQIDFPESICSSVVIANATLYITTEKHLYAIK